MTRNRTTEQHDPDGADHTLGPIRTCIGCRTRRPQAALVRCVLSSDGRARLDRRGHGRGAWLCGAECFEVALRRRAFERAWRVTVPPGALDTVATALTRTS